MGYILAGFWIYNNLKNKNIPNDELTEEEREKYFKPRIW